MEIKIICKDMFTHGSDTVVIYGDSQDDFFTVPTRFVRLSQTKEDEIRSLIEQRSRSVQDAAKPRDSAPKKTVTKATATPVLTREEKQKLDNDSDPGLAHARELIESLEIKMEPEDLPYRVGDECTKDGSILSVEDAMKLSDVIVAASLPANRKNKIYATAARGALAMLTAASMKNLMTVAPHIDSRVRSRIVLDFMSGSRPPGGSADFTPATLGQFLAADKRYMEEIVEAMPIKVEPQKEAIINDENLDDDLNEAYAEEMSSRQRLVIDEALLARLASQ